MSHSLSRSFACLALVFVTLGLAAPNATAGKFSNFIGDYSGSAKITVGAVAYAADADAVFKLVSNGKNGKFTITGTEANGKIQIKLTLKSGGACTLKIQPTDNLTIQASGTYVKNSSKKVSLTLSAVVSGVDISGPGTLQMTSATKIKLSGSLTGTSSSSGKTVTVQYRYQGKEQAD